MADVPDDVADGTGVRRAVQTWPMGLADDALLALGVFHVHLLEDGVQLRQHLLQRRFVVFCR